jgi:hypothetical protein
MKNKTIFLVLFLILSFQSCEEEVSLNNSVYKDKIEKYLSSVKNVDTNQSSKIETLEKRIDFTSVIEYDLRTTENLIIAELLPNPNITDSDKSKLILFVNNNEIARGFVVDFKSKSEFHKYNELVLSILNISTETFKYTGTITFKNLFEKTLLYNNYNSGELTTNGIARTRLSDSKKGRTNSCIDWFMVTTYYYANGSTRTEETYLFTTCDDDCGLAGARVQCGGGGGTGQQANSQFPPNPQDGDEYEVTDRDGIYTKYVWDSARGIWKGVIRILPVLVVQDMPLQYPELQIQWPVNGQKVFTPDNMIYTYSGPSGNWVGEANVEVAPAIVDVIADIIEYLECFNRSSPAQLTIYVDEPVPGSGQSHDKSDVGHVFISITQQVNSQMITRTFGFYPSGWVTPLNPSSGGDIVNDSGHEYNVQLTLTLNPTQLTDLLNNAISNNNSDYNLNTFNCTNFAVNACSSGGLNLPRTIGVWPGGRGLNPGNLGKDIMNMTLPTNYVSRSNGGGVAPSNTGNCD